MTFFVISSGPLWDHNFYNAVLTDRLNKVRIILKRTLLIILPDYINAIKYFKMTLNSKHRKEKLSTKNQRYKNAKNQNTERRKPSFTKRIGRECRLTHTLTEQITDHTRIIHKIQFCSFFKEVSNIKS